VLASSNDPPVLSHVPDTPMPVPIQHAYAKTRLCTKPLRARARWLPGGTRSSLVLTRYVITTDNVEHIWFSQGGQDGPAYKKITHSPFFLPSSTSTTTTCMLVGRLRALLISSERDPVPGVLEVVRRKTTVAAL